MRVEGYNGALADLNHQLTTTIMFNFEKLDTWQEAIDFADLIYRLTRTFPDGERFGLTSQMRRATVSISSNIAEGSSRSSRVDFARFIEMGAGSVYEVVSQATIAKRQGLLPEEDYQLVYAAAEKQSRMLSGLRKSLLDDAR
jgi:four helix bundle protein